MARYELWVLLPLYAGSGNMLGLEAGSEYADYSRLWGPAGDDRTGAVRKAKEMKAKHGRDFFVVDALLRATDDDDCFIWPWSECLWPLGEENFSCVQRMDA